MAKATVEFKILVKNEEGYFFKWVKTSIKFDSRLDKNHRAKKFAEKCKMPPIKNIEEDISAGMAFGENKVCPDGKNRIAAIKAIQWINKGDKMQLRFCIDEQKIPMKFKFCTSETKRKCSSDYLESGGAGNWIKADKYRGMSIDIGIKNIFAHTIFDANIKHNGDWMFSIVDKDVIKASQVGTPSVRDIGTQDYRIRRSQRKLKHTPDGKRPLNKREFEERIWLIQK